MSNPGATGADRLGLLYGVSAYTLWGVFPLYFKAVAHIAPWVVLCHRVLWSVLFLGMVIAFRHEWRTVTSTIRGKRIVGLLAIGACLIASNWGIFIYAVGSNQVLQASLGYFINPLFSIALGMVFLGERLRTLQWVAVGIAILAVFYFAWQGGGMPWIALSLATTFAFYGLVRKKVDVNSLHGLLVESAILLPAAFVFIFFVPAAKVSGTDWAILSASGVITAVPLLLFGAAVRKLSLSTVGFLQYIGPTLQFLLATLLLGEPLQQGRVVSFALVWAGIAVYIVDSVLSRRPQPVADEPE